MGAECCKATGNVASFNLYTDFAGDSDLKTSISQATNLLRKAQAIKQTLQSCRERSEKITTIPLRDSLTFIQNTQVLQWGLSALHHGNIQQAGFSILDFSPFLDIKANPINRESYELLECLRIYLDTVNTQADTMKQIVEDSYGLRAELSKWTQSRESQDEKEGSKATSYKKLVQEMRAITSLEESLRETKAKMPWIIEKMQSLMLTADEVGFQADREKLSNMRDIASRFRIALETGQDKKKWVMRTSNLAQDALKTRDSNVHQLNKGKGLRESSKSIENRENAKQYQSISFGANFSSLKSNISRNRDSLTLFQSTKDSAIGEKARLPLADLKRLGTDNGKMKESSVTFRVRATDLENNGKFIQLGSKHNPFTIGSTEVSNGSLQSVPATKSKGAVKVQSCSLIKEKVSLLDMEKISNMMNENLIDDDNLSISLVQDSARKPPTKVEC